MVPLGAVAAAAIVRAPAAADAIVPAAAIEAVVALAVMMPAEARPPMPVAAKAATPTTITAVRNAFAKSQAPCDCRHMRLATLFLSAGLVLSLGAAGPASKFDGKHPDVSEASARTLGDIERCLIDADGLLAPIVYRQPDRPNDVRILWSRGNGLTQARADLSSSPRGVLVRAWGVEKQVRACL